MKILIVGSAGMLGSECKEVLSHGHSVVTRDKKELNIVSWDKVIETLHQVRPDAVLNCAGINNMEFCEKEGFLARKVNVEGTRNLAQGSARYDCKFIQVSSGFIFDGNKPVPQPYFEDDPGNPLSEFGRTKMESETAVRSNAPDYIIVRTAWPYGINGDNMVKSIIQKALKKRPKVIRIPQDHYSSPTWAHRLALQIGELLRIAGKGTYHLTAGGYCSEFDYAQFVLEKLGIKATVEPCSLKDLQDVPRRPANCILENRLVKKQGIYVMVPWKKDLTTFLETFGERLIKEAKMKKG